MNIRNSLTFLTGLYLAVLVWWLSIFLSGSTGGSLNAFFSLFWGLFIVLGALLLIYLIVSHVKYRFKINIKYSLIAILLGVSCWGVGNVIWALFSLLSFIEMPFPSIADAAFVLSYPLLFIGMLGVFFPKLHRPRVNFLHILTNWGFLLLLFLTFPLVSIILFSINYSDFREVLHMIKLILNIYYVGYDILIVAVGLYSVVFRKFMSFAGFDYVSGPLILFTSSVVLLFSDCLFFIYSMQSTYFNGSYVDMLFVTSFFGVLISMFKIISNEFPMTLVEDTHNTVFVIRMTYLKEVGLNMRILFS